MGIFKFDCPHCRQAIEADESYCGQVAECPYCEHSIIVPKIVKPVARIYDNNQVPSKKNGFWGWIRRRYLTTKGRATRAEFLKCYALIWILYALLCVGAIGAILLKKSAGALLFIPVLFLTGIGFLCIHIRRLHDLNRSEWWYLACIVGSIACCKIIDCSIGAVLLHLIWFVVLASFDGTSGRNDYGDDPKGRSSIGNYRDKSKLIIATLSVCSIIIPVIATFIILQKSHNVSSLDQVNQSVQEITCDDDDMITVQSVRLRRLKDTVFQKNEDENGNIVFVSELPEEAGFMPSITIYDFEEENLKDVLPSTRTTTIFQQKFMEGTIENIKNELKELECDVKILKRTESTLTVLLSFETHYAYQKLMVDFRKGRSALVQGCYKFSWGQNAKIIKACVDSSCLANP